MLQVESPGHNWRALQHDFLERQQQQQQQQRHVAAGVFDAAALEAALRQPQQGASRGAPDAWPGQPPGLRAGAAVASLTGDSSGQREQLEQQQPVPPYTQPEPAYSGTGRGSSNRKSLRAWGAEDTHFAAGSGNGGGGDLVARHPLHIESAYGAVTGTEAAYSTCHDK